MTKQTLSRFDARSPFNKYCSTETNLMLARKDICNPWLQLTLTILHCCHGNKWDEENVQLLKMFSLQWKLKSIFYNHFHANDNEDESCFFIYFLLYLKWTLAVVVLHFFVSSTNKQHSGTVILGKKEEIKHYNKYWGNVWNNTKNPFNSPTLFKRNAD